MKKFLSGLIISFTFAGCDIFYKNISGSGNIIRKTIDNRWFDSISTEGGYQIIHSEDVSSSKIEVTTDDNLFEYIDIYVSGGKLNINLKDNYNLNPTKGIVIKTSLLNVEKVDSMGSLELYFDKIDRNSLSIYSSGSLKADLLGKVTDFTLDGSGSVNLTAGNLKCNKAILTVSGSIYTIITVKSKLDLDISGSGIIEYYGNPIVKNDLSGNIEIKRLGN